jgi:hypothetical protein
MASQLARKQPPSVEALLRSVNPVPVHIREQANEVVAVLKRSVAEMESDSRGEAFTPSPEKAPPSASTPVARAGSSLLREAGWVCTDLGDGRPTSRALESDSRLSVITHVSGGTPAKSPPNTILNLFDSDDEDIERSAAVKAVRQSIETDLLRAPTATGLLEKVPPQPSPPAPAPPSEAETLNKIPTTLESVYALSQQGRVRKGKKRKVADEERAAPGAVSESVDEALHFIKQELPWPVSGAASVPNSEAPTKKRRKKPPKVAEALD